jgi:RNA polymerase subunit RPABC4/transcription elongation factor Spt4
VKLCRVCGRSDFSDDENWCPDCERNSLVDINSAVVCRSAETKSPPEAASGESADTQTYPCGHVLEAGHDRCPYCEGPAAKEPVKAKLATPWGGLLPIPEGGLFLGRDTAFSPHAAELATWDNVSGRHAVIRPASDGLLVEDCDSTNGTFLDGRRLLPVTPPEQRLALIGSVIRLGSDPPVEFRVVSA